VSALAAERARSPELLFQASCNDLSFDDRGELTNAADLVAGLRLKFPEQFAADAPPAPLPVPPIPPIESGAGRTGGRPPLTREMLASMNPREIADLDWHEVKQILEH